jgi:hypothetical protein
MRRWQNFWRTLVYVGEHNPPQLVEMLMMSLTVVLFSIWLISPDSFYLILGLIYAFGSGVSILVRESRLLTRRPPLTQVATLSLASLLLLISLYGVADLVFSV